MDWSSRCMPRAENFQILFSCLRTLILSKVFRYFRHQVNQHVRAEASTDRVRERDRAREGRKKGAGRAHSEPSFGAEYS